MKNVKAGHSRPVVCLDAGHYGDYNRSPAVWEYFESDMTWKLHLLLKTALEGYGIEVKTTRANQDSDMGEYERGTASRGCDLLLSLHSNAAGSQVNETADHVIVIVPLNGSGDELGQMFVDRISLIMGVRQKGRIETRQGNNGDYFGVIRGAIAVGTVGLILEHSFHTNTRITNWLLKEENLARLAAEEASIIAEYFGVLDAVPENAPPVENGQLYRVQLGAFRIKANAEALLAELSAGGYEGYIVGEMQEDSIQETASYTLRQFVLDIQTAIGAEPDGIAGADTLKRLPSISQMENDTHSAVLPVQKRLQALGYVGVGTPDGIAGPSFDSAVKQFQTDNGILPDGELTAGGKSWQLLLGIA